MSDYKSLLHCPKNLRECLGWLVRISGKETGGTGNINSLESLAKAVNAELETAVQNVPTELINWIPDLGNNCPVGKALFFLSRSMLSKFFLFSMPL
ncbi:hypothetical protein X943_003830 [Babesia divergens]|uniref:Uncharacterized protein n=1 Tax=Babesia divergens TaxID=32595 RepID=A0AAD9GBC1_BABDI|nr:hypothetical protein X943_003830 [Babesia divergens]